MCAQSHINTHPYITILSQSMLLKGKVRGNPLQKLPKTHPNCQFRKIGNLAEGWGLSRDMGHMTWENFGKINQVRRDKITQHEERDGNNKSVDLSSDMGRTPSHQAMHTYM